MDQNSLRYHAFDTIILLIRNTLVPINIGPEFEQISLLVQDNFVLYQVICENNNILVFYKNVAKMTKKGLEFLTAERN